MAPADRPSTAPPRRQTSQAAEANVKVVLRCRCARATRRDATRRDGNRSPVVVVVVVPLFVPLRENDDPRPHRHLPPPPLLASIASQPHERDGARRADARGGQDARRPRPVRRRADRGEGAARRDQEDGGADVQLRPRRVRIHTGSRTTALAWCTPVLKDFCSLPAGASLRPPLDGFNPDAPRRLSTNSSTHPPDAFRLRPDVVDASSYGTTRPQSSARTRARATCTTARSRPSWRRYWKGSTARSSRTGRRGRGRRTRWKGISPPSASVSAPRRPTTSHTRAVCLTF